MRKWQGRMRLLIDSIPLLVRSAGVKNYLFHWIVHLRQLLGDDQVRLFPFLDRLPALDHEGSVAGPSGTLARQALFFFLNLQPTRAIDVLASRADIYHATKLLTPPRRPRLTATLHDLTCWLMPEFHQADNVAAEKRFADSIWKRAAGLIAVSENTRQDAIRVLNLDPQKVRVIYPGVAQPYFAATAATATTARARYDLVRDYVLYIGTVEPRKNIDRLLNAWQQLPVGFYEQYDLVLAGPVGWHSENTMARLRTPSHSVRYLGYVPEADLPAITAGATLFVYPSLYEGFGFPVAQAMAAGVPVLTSNLSSLPEITAGAAHLIDPRSESDLRQALDHLLTSPDSRAAYAAAGRTQAQLFRWEVCAQQSLSFFQEILSK